MDKPKILIVDDEKPIRDTLAKWLKPAYACLTAPGASEALAVLKSDPDIALLITDVKMPDEDGVSLLQKAKDLREDLGVVLLTAYGSVDLAVEAMKVGADDFVQKPVTDLNAFERRIGDVIRRVQERAGRKAETSPLDKGAIEGFTGASPAMERVYRLIRKVAPTNATVLVEGPSGTGKELVARALHALSPRANRPFIAVECAALSKELLASELFGYAPGTFTGGLKDGKAGCFEAASGGTLFLDEIGEIDAETQVKLLRAIESRTVVRLGSSAAIPVDFRLVAATNKNLMALVAAGTFREDLYYRLNVIDIRTPALKDHPEDIPLLVTRFLTEFSAANGNTVSGIDDAAMQALAAYAWPGNVRQLRNVIEKMVILAGGPKITVADLPAEITAPPMTPSMPESQPMPASQGAPQTQTLAETEKERILAALRNANNNKSKAALQLGISRRTLHRKLNEWNEHD